MPHLPLEDNYTDVIGKAQRGLKITDERLSAVAEVSLADLATVKAGQVNDAVIRRVARHLRLTATPFVRFPCFSPTELPRGTLRSANSTCQTYASVG